MDASEGEEIKKNVCCLERGEKVDDFRNYWPGCNYCVVGPEKKNIQRVRVSQIEAAA